MLVIVMSQNNGSIVHGPFDTLAELQAYAVRVFGDFAADLRESNPKRSKQGNYELEATTLVKRWQGQQGKKLQESLLKK